MEIKSLSKDVIARIQSSCNINNLTQCITELVLNSLDAKSSAIAVRINSMNFKVLVVDNGVGISQENMEKIGLKHMTSKCARLEDLDKKAKLHGYQGISLWGISNVSKILTFTSKYSNSETTFSKDIINGKHGNVSLVKNRQSNGTTVIIDGLFNNLPVRQKRMKKEFELEEIINSLRSISLIHPQISFSLRDDLTGKLLFKSQKYNNVIQSFVALHTDITEDDLTLIRVHKEKVTIESFLLKQIFYNKMIQYIFVNRRPVEIPKLQNYICREFLKDKKRVQMAKGNSFPMFIINIKCSLSSFNLIYKDSKPTVEFNNLDLIDRCIQKLVSNFLGKPEKVKETPKGASNLKSVCGVSDLIGAMKGYGFKDWLRNDHNKRHSNVGNTPSLSNDEDISVEYTPVGIKIKHTAEECEGKKVKPLPIEICEQKGKREHPKTIGKIEINKKETSTSSNIKKGSSEKENFSLRAIVNKNIDEDIVRNYQQLEKNCEKIIKKQELDKTLFSNFTTSEDKGKSLIMYMFLKSTELFPENASQEQSLQLSEKCNDSRETIMESNIFYENVTKTKTHQLNKTVSVSVKVKRQKNERVEEEKSDNLNNLTFTSFKRERRRSDYLNEVPNCTNLKRKNQVTSPFFERKKFKKGMDKDKRYIDKIIQTTLNERNENLFGFSETFKSQKKISRIYAKENDEISAYTIIPRGKGRLNNQSNVCGDHNIVHPNFVPDMLENTKISYNFDFFRGRKFQEEFHETSIFDNHFHLNNEYTKLYDCNDSYVFDFKKNRIPERDIFHNMNFSNFIHIDRPRKALLDCEPQNDSNFNSTFKPISLAFEKSFDFANLSLSPIPKMFATPVPRKCSKSHFGIGKVEARNTKNLLPFRKFATDGNVWPRNNYFHSDMIFSPYFKNKNENRKDSFLFNDVNMKTIENGNKYIRQSEFRRSNTEPFNDSRKLYLKKMKANLDKLFVKRNPKLHIKSNNLEDIEIFTRDSLENNPEIPMVSDNDVLWKKFVERKNNLYNINEKTKEIPLFKGRISEEIPTKNKNIFTLKNVNQFLKPINTEFASKKNMFEEYVSPDLFSESKMSPVNQMNEIKVQVDLTFRPNSVASFEIGPNSSLYDSNIISKNGCTEKESHPSTLTAVEISKTSNLVVTIDENVRRQLIAKELEADAKMNVGISSTASDEMHEWIKKLDHQGKEFYFNTRTGMTSFKCPVQDDGFNFRSRPEFMPKGLSPVLLREDKLDDTLTSISKEKLQDEILKSYETELDIVKWEKCLKGSDPKIFFEEMYKERAKNFENEVPNINRSSLPRCVSKLSCEYKFRKSLFGNLEIIGQVDQKFIAVLDRKQKNLILFDQHAVHERIRLENLIKEYEGVTISCENVTLFMTQNDVKLLKNHEEYLKVVGFHFRSLKNGITVHKVPLCLHNKVRKEPKESTWNLPKLIELLIQEILRNIKDTRGILTGLPKTIHQIISSEACRGSIKFGDTLTKKEMEKHMENLSNCSLCFQCAHGRPTLVPILSLIEESQQEYSKPQLGKLRKS